MKTVANTPSAVRRIAQILLVPFCLGVIMPSPVFALRGAGLEENAALPEVARQLGVSVEAVHAHHAGVEERPSDETSAMSSTRVSTRAAGPSEQEHARFGAWSDQRAKALQKEAETNGDRLIRQIVGADIPSTFDLERDYRGFLVPLLSAFSDNPAGAQRVLMQLRERMGKHPEDRQVWDAMKQEGARLLGPRYRNSLQFALASFSRSEDLADRWCIALADMDHEYGKDLLSHLWRKDMESDTAEWTRWIQALYEAYRSHVDTLQALVQWDLRHRFPSAQGFLLLHGSATEKISPGPLNIQDGFRLAWDLGEAQAYAKSQAWVVQVPFERVTHTSWLSRTDHGVTISAGPVQVLATLEPSELESVRIPYGQLRFDDWHEPTTPSWWRSEWASARTYTAEQLPEWTKRLRTSLATVLATSSEKPNVAAGLEERGMARRAARAAQMGLALLGVHTAPLPSGAQTPPTTPPPAVAPAQPLVVLQKPLTGAPYLEIQGPVDARAYHVYAATNVVQGPWERVVENLPAASSGVTLWTDYEYADRAQRFYWVEVSSVPGPHQEYLRHADGSVTILTYDAQDRQMTREDHTTTLNAQGRVVTTIMLTSPNFRPLQRQEFVYRDSEAKRLEISTETDFEPAPTTIDFDTTSSRPRQRVVDTFDAQGTRVARVEIRYSYDATYGDLVGWTVTNRDAQDQVIDAEAIAFPLDVPGAPPDGKLAEKLDEALKRAPAVLAVLTERPRFDGGVIGYDEFLYRVIRLLKRSASFDQSAAYLVPFLPQFNPQQAGESDDRYRARLARLESLWRDGVFLLDAEGHSLQTPDLLDILADHRKNHPGWMDMAYFIGGQVGNGYGGPGWLAVSTDGVATDRQLFATLTLHEIGHALQYRDEHDTRIRALDQVITYWFNHSSAPQDFVSDARNSENDLSSARLNEHEYFAEHTRVWYSDTKLWLTTALKNYQDNHPAMLNMFLAIWNLTPQPTDTPAGTRPLFKLRDDGLLHRDWIPGGWTRGGMQDGAFTFTFDGRAYTATYQNYQISGVTSIPAGLEERVTVLTADGRNPFPAPAEGERLTVIEPLTIFYAPDKLGARVLGMVETAPESLRAARPVHFVPLIPDAERQPRPHDVVVYPEGQAPEHAEALRQQGIILIPITTDMTWAELLQAFLTQRLGLEQPAGQVLRAELRDGVLGLWTQA